MKLNDLIFFIVADRTSITWSEIREAAANLDGDLSKHQQKSLADQAAYVLASEYGWRVYDSGMGAID